MDKMPKYYIVEAAALPEVFLKVAEAKQMLDSGEAATVGEATKATGISRSAFYKYRDAMMPFQNLMAGHIITFQLMLKDRTGVLSCPVYFPFLPITAQIYSPLTKIFLPTAARL